MSDVIKLYTRFEAAEILSCNPQTVKIKCQKLVDNVNIILVGNRYVITTAGIELIRAHLQPKGYPRGKKRAKISKI